MSVHVAFYGRSGNPADPDQANHDLATQYRACLRALPPGARITAIYYDLSPTGRPHPHPPQHLTVAGTRLERDGGLGDLLTHASEPRRFDQLIVASLDRLSRDTRCLVTLQRLHNLGVGLLFADLPCLNATRAAPAIIAILTHLARYEADASRARSHTRRTTRPALPSSVAPRTPRSRRTSSTPSASSSPTTRHLPKES